MQFHPMLRSPFIDKDNKHVVISLLISFQTAITRSSCLLRNIPMLFIEINLSNTVDNSKLSLLLYSKFFTMELFEASDLLFTHGV